MIGGMEGDYNTVLSPEEEKAFSAWATQNGREQDTYDYDLRGWFKENGPQSLSEAHLTDKYKKPNHPTFSIDSQYHGVDGNVGGTWKKDPSGYSFVPGSTNLGMYSPAELQEYFRRVEPGNKLLLPE